MIATPPFPATAPEATASDVPSTPRELLTWAWQHVEREPQYPLGTRHVFSLAKLCGYRIDRRYFNHLLSQGLLQPRPPRAHRTYRWHAADIIRLLELLESKRRWYGAHPAHRAKLSNQELADSLAEASGTLLAIEYLRSLPTDALWGLLSSARSEDARSAIGTILREKMGQS